MPQTCCIPGCKSNYKDTAKAQSEYVSVFTFPKNAELRNKWIKCVPRKNWSPTPRSVVCVKHFQTSDVIVSDTFTDKTGTLCVVPRGRPSLKPNAYPTVFPGIPGYQVPIFSYDPKAWANDVYRNHKVNSMMNMKSKGRMASCGTIQEPDYEDLTIKDELNEERETNIYSSMKNSKFRSFLYPARNNFLCCEKRHVKYERTCPEHGLMVYFEDSETDHNESHCLDFSSQDQANGSRLGHGQEKRKTFQSFDCEAHDDDDEKTQTGEKLYTCYVCGENFTGKGNLNKHKKTHTEEKSSYKCKVCGEDFSCSESFKAHKRMHVEEKRYFCDVCGRDFNRSGSLKRHKATHTGEKPYLCDICGDHFSQIQNLKKHKRKHTGQKPYICDVCGRGFAESGTLKRHKRVHTGEKPYKCTICNEGFSKSWNLKIHMRIHARQNPYKCNFCGENFIRYAELKQHKKTHTGVKPYKCDVCVKVCGDRGALIKHKRTHTGEKPYICDVCGTCFADKSTLIRHKRIHTGVKSYKCDVCGRGFAENKTLQRHIRTHTGDKPFICDVCNASFADNRTLKRHQKTHECVLPNLMLL